MNKKPVTAPQVLEEIKRMKCPTKGCGRKMKFIQSNGRTAGFECKKCGCYRGILIDALKQIREDWWNL